MRVRERSNTRIVESANARSRILSEARGLESVRTDEELIATIIRHSFHPTQSAFLTRRESSFQLGVLTYGRARGTPAHTHPEVRRIIVKPQEFVMVMRGKIRVNFFDSAQRFVGSRILSKDDCVLFRSGGRGWKAIEPSVLIEVKQGPFLGESDKIVITKPSILERPGGPRRSLS